MVNYDIIIVISFEGVCGEHTNVILVSGAGKVGPGALPFTSIPGAKAAES